MVRTIKIQSLSDFKVYNIILSTTFPMRCVKEFRSKIEPEDMKWRISHRHPQKNKALKLWEAAFPCMPNLQKTKTYVLTSEWQESLPILKPVSLLRGLWLDFPSSCSLPVDIDHPKLSSDSCGLLQHEFPELQFLRYSKINSISGHWSLPQFTSLFNSTWESDL